MTHPYLHISNKLHASFSPLIPQIFYASCRFIGMYAKQTPQRTISSSRSARSIKPKFCTSGPTDQTSVCKSRVACVPPEFPAASCCGFKGNELACALCLVTEVWIWEKHLIQEVFPVNLLLNQIKMQCNPMEISQQNRIIT